MLAATYLYRFERFSRGVFIIDAVLLLLAILGSRLSFRFMAHAAVMQSTRARRVLICGAGERGRLLAREMLANTGWHMKPVGFIDSGETSEHSLLGVRVVGRSTTCADVLERLRVDEVVFSGDPIEPAQRQRALRTCADRLDRRARPDLRDARNRAGTSTAAASHDGCRPDRQLEQPRTACANACESLSAQTRTPDRVILVDNNSTDDSLAAGGDSLAGRRGHPAARRTPASRARTTSRPGRPAASTRWRSSTRTRFPTTAGWPRSSPRPNVSRTLGSFASRIVLDAQPDFLDGAGDSYHSSGRAWRNGHRMRAREWAAGDHGGVRAVRRRRAVPARRIRSGRRIRRAVLLLFRGRRPRLPPPPAGIPVPCTCTTRSSGT